jgi:CSLREA domain-containing protein
MRTTSFTSTVFSKFLNALAILALAMVALPVMPASAATITVNTTLDDNANNALCSLREAIIAANNNAAYNGCAYVGTGPDDIITLTSGTTYTLSIIGPDEDEGDLDVGNAMGTSGNLTIQASGTTNAIIDANQINRVIEDDVSDTDLTLSHITITGGLSPDGAGIYFSGNGTLTLMNSAVIGNVATGGANCGAGIYNASEATINIENSTFEGNSCTGAGADGGGVYKNTGGTLNITNSTFNDNTVTDDGGGVLIDIPGTATITNSTLQIILQTAEVAAFRLPTVRSPSNFRRFQAMLPISSVQAPGALFRLLAALCLFYGAFLPIPRVMARRQRIVTS